MKKFFAFLMFTFIAAMAVVTATQPDTIPVNIVTGGDSILDILKANWAVLAVIFYSVLEFWLGQTGKIKEGSFLALIINFIGKFIRKQLPVVKGKFMSETQFKAVRGLKVMLLLLFLIPLSASAQGPWDGFFKPKTGIKTDLLKADGDQSAEWFFRPAATLTALQFSYDKELNAFTSSTFSSTGVGLGYQHYVEKNGTLVNNFGVNALLMLDASAPDAGLAAAATFNALQFVNLGGGFNFTEKQFFIITGAIWTF